MIPGTDHKSNHIWPIVYGAKADCVNGDLTVQQHHYVQTLQKKRIVVFNVVVSYLMKSGGPDQTKIKEEVTMKVSPCVDTEQ